MSLRIELPNRIVKPPINEVAWASYILVGFSSIYFLRGILFNSQPVDSHSYFRIWAVLHTLAAGLIALKSAETNCRHQAANLVKLTGYLYTLTGLILVVENYNSATEPIITGAGGALLSSLIGWFFGGLIEREHTPLVSGDNISLALDAQLTRQLNSELKATADMLGTSREKLIEAEQELTHHQALLQRTNQLLDEVNQFIHQDPLRRQIEETHRDEVLRELTTIKSKLS